MVVDETYGGNVLLVDAVVLLVVVVGCGFVTSSLKCKLGGTSG